MKQKKQKQTTITMTILLIVAGMLIGAGGCGVLQDVPHIGGRWIYNQRIQYVNEHPNIPEKIKNAIRRGEVILGMTQSQVIASFGHPGTINRTSGSWGVYEQWVYSRGYLYFENGILTSWQN